ncbi:SH3 domain-containing protein [Streptomyces durbertensis]|uniref:SH3 domain-containing protein n=1 Tax=Streptomyces durbertensis TaxID=2448886 RepID=A0ABR6EI71_9ACTN|nr:SH3 domain-containing protein [Streptomyces durbertensis]MBB1245047.1 SH3 domain-containing protein [Streptomyces durbertensis]
MQLNRKIAAGLAAGALATSLLGVAPAVAAEPLDGKGGAAEAPMMDHARHAAWGKVVAKSGVNIRAYPSVKARKLGAYPYGAKIKLRCKVKRQLVHGNPYWYKLDTRSGWVSARWVKNLNHVPYCR